jgi:CheY-like chemotaxis protein
MQKVLLVENHARLENLYGLNLMLWVGVEVHSVKSGAEALDFLQTHNDVSLVISRKSINKELTIQTVLKTLETLNLNCPIICLGVDLKLPDDVIQLPSGLILKELVQASAKALGVTAREMAERPVPEYYPLPIDYFLDIKTSNVAVFQKKDDGSYLKRIEIDEVFDPLIVKELEANGVPELFVLRDDRLKFVHHVSQEYISRIDLNELSENEQITATEVSTDVLSQKLQLLGINEETVDLAKKNMKAVTRMAKKNPKLAQLMKSFLITKPLTVLSMFKF